VIDFFRALQDDPSRLRVLGNGRQRKSYLYVQDCVDGMLRAMEAASDKVNILNLGTDDYCTVMDSIGVITSELGVSPEIVLTGGSRGWIGDSPFIFLDCQKVRSLGWRPSASIREGIVRTVRYLKDNPWVLEARSK